MLYLPCLLPFFFFAQDHPRLAYQLRNAVEKARRGVYMLQRYNVDFGEDPPEPKLPKNMSTKLSLFDFDAEEIARQMTLIDFQIFAQIKVTLLSSYLIS